MSETNFDIRPTIIVLGTVIGLLFSIFVLNPIHKKNIEKLKSNKPIDRQKITIDNFIF